jgi:hypothetical protein
MAWAKRFRFDRAVLGNGSTRERSGISYIRITNRFPREFPIHHPRWKQPVAQACTHSCKKSPSAILDEVRVL